MKVTGISWVGLNTDAFDRSVEFFADTVGLRLTHRDDAREVAHFRLAEGDMFEVFGPGHPSERRQRLAVAFEVEDLMAARAELTARGVDCTEIETWKDHAWCYFTGPDGLEYELKQSGRRR